MSFLGLLPQISIPPMEVGGVDDPAVARRFADRLRKQLEDMQQELQDDDQLEVVAFLPSGAAVRVEVVGYHMPALIVLKGQEQASGKLCSILVHQSALQLLVTVEKIPVGQCAKTILFEAE